MNRSRVIDVLNALEARYPHRLPKVADSPTKMNLDFVHNSLMKKRKRKPMDKLVNNNGQWIRT